MTYKFKILIRTDATLFKAKSENFRQGVLRNRNKLLVVLMKNLNLATDNKVMSKHLFLVFRVFWLMFWVQWKLLGFFGTKTLGHIRHRLSSVSITTLKPCLVETAKTHEKSSFLQNEDVHYTYKCFFFFVRHMVTIYFRYPFSYLSLYYINCLKNNLYK